MIKSLNFDSSLSVSKRNRIIPLFFFYKINVRSFYLNVFLAQISNTWDQRIFNAYCTEIFRQELITTSQCTLVSEDRAYQLPRDGNFTSYVNFITNQLPQEDSIRVLGQNENANIKYLESRSTYVLQMLRQVQVHAEATQYDQQHGLMDYEKVCLFYY